MFFWLINCCPTHWKGTNSSYHCWYLHPDEEPVCVQNVDYKNLYEYTYKNKDKDNNNRRCMHHW